MTTARTMLEKAQSPVRSARRRLAQRRAAAGYTQQTLASRLGVDRITVWRWETRGNKPQVSLRSKLARALALTPAQLDELLAEAAAD